MQRLGGGSRATRKRKTRGGGNDPRCGCDMQAGWPKFLTENIPLPTLKGGGSCGIPPIPNYYRGGGQPTVYNSNPVPDACPFPGTGYCGFYAKGGANYGEPMYLQARLRGGSLATTGLRGGSLATTGLRGGSLATTGLRGGANNNNNSTISNNTAESIYNNEQNLWQAQQNMEEYRQQMINAMEEGYYAPNNNNNNNNNNSNRNNNPSPVILNTNASLNGNDPRVQDGGGCGCMALKGGYRPTKKNLKALKKWRKGQSIGFTMTSSLKAKGLIPRTSRKYKGKKVVSAKYK